MRNKIFIACLSLGITLSFRAQQIELSSHYYQNMFMFNPSVAGQYDYSPVYINYRQQWTGFEEAPSMQFLSYHTRLVKNLGAGINLYNDVTGPVRRTGGLLAVSYAMKTSSKSKLSFALAASVTQFSFNLDKLVTELPNDIALSNSLRNQVIPDATFGVNFRTKKMRVGLSAYNLIEVGKNLFESDFMVENRLERTIYAHADYTADFSKKLSLTPYFLVRYMSNSPFQAEVSAKLLYNKMFWIGASYRLQDALVAFAGMDYKNFVVGYSYDYTISELSGYNSGSHEIILGYKIMGGTNGQGSWFKRNRVYIKQ